MKYLALTYQSAALFDIGSAEISGKQTVNIIGSLDAPFNLVAHVVE